MKELIPGRILHGLTTGMSFSINSIILGLFSYSIASLPLKKEKKKNTIFFLLNLLSEK